MKKTLKIIINFTSIVMAAAILLSSFSAFAATGRWIKSGERWWYRHSDASYTTNNWEKINNKWYYFDAQGWMKTGWIRSNGKWYYLDKRNGDMKSNCRVCEIKGKREYNYYLNQSGTMRTGWLYSSDRDNWQYFKSNGVMAQNEWVGDYYFDSDGWIYDKEPGLQNLDKKIVRVDMSYYESVPADTVYASTQDEELISLLQSYLGHGEYSPGARTLIMGGQVYTFELHYDDGTTDKLSLRKGEQEFVSNQMYYIGFDSNFAVSFFDTIYDGE